MDAWEVCISNFKATFSFAEDFIKRMPMVCINSKKCSAVASCLQKYLVKDVIEIILSHLRNNVFEGVLFPIEEMDWFGEEEGYSVQGKDGIRRELKTDDFVFSIEKNRKKASLWSHLFFGVFSEKPPKIESGSGWELLKTDIQKDGKTFYANPCPFLISGIPYISILTDISCDYLYLFSPCLDEYMEKARSENGCIVYKNSKGEKFADDYYGFLSFV